MLFGYLNFSFWQTALVTLIMIQISIASVTIYLHRCQSHRSLELHPIISHFFRFWLWLTTGQVTKEWVSIHRKHHALCETDDDPHSPVAKGIRTVLWQGAELYQKEAKNKETLEKYGSKTPEDWIEHNLYSKYSTLGIVLMFLIDIFLFGVAGITVWALQMMAMPLFAAGIINGIGHFWGYRNFEVKDASRNITPWAVFLGGEELHNNHHTFSNSAKLSVKKWEFDIGWMYIKILSFFGLAKVRRVHPKLKVENQKPHFDRQIVTAILRNRFQVMANYSDKVIKPVLKDLKKSDTTLTNRWLRQARKLLSRETNLVNAESKAKLHQIIARREHLNVIYQLRLELQAIWNNTANNQKELIVALQQWCQHAKSQGIEALSEFADSLKGYATAK